MNIASPCINVCRMDEASGYCEGCYRTLPEIAEWRRATEARQQAILADAARRRAAATPHTKPGGPEMSDDNPCIGICEIEDGYCIGCGRSADEIFGDPAAPTEPADAAATAGTGPGTADAAA